MLGGFFRRNFNDRRIFGCLQNLDGLRNRQTFHVNDFAVFRCDDDLAIGLRSKPRNNNDRKSTPRRCIFQGGENINDPPGRHRSFGQLDTAAELDAVFRKSIYERCSAVFENMNRK